MKTHGPPQRDGPGDQVKPNAVGSGSDKPIGIRSRVEQCIQNPHMELVMALFGQDRKETVDGRFAVLIRRVRVRAGR